MVDIDGNIHLVDMDGNFHLVDMDGNVSTWLIWMEISTWLIWMEVHSFMENNGLNNHMKLLKVILIYAYITEVNYGIGDVTIFSLKFVIRIV